MLDPAHDGRIGRVVLEDDRGSLRARVVDDEVHPVASEDRLAVLRLPAAQELAERLRGVRRAAPREELHVARDVVLH